jgi:hypothetical protein
MILPPFEDTDAVTPNSLKFLHSQDTLSFWSNDDVVFVSKLSVSQLITLWSILTFKCGDRVQRYYGITP